MVIKRITESKSSETVFILSNNENEAYGYPDMNIMVISKDLLTIETLIHEFNELEIRVIISRMINKELTKLEYYKMRSKNIIHKLSPYGYKSYINPFKNIDKENNLLKDVVK